MPSSANSGLYALVIASEDEYSAKHSCRSKLSNEVGVTIIVDGAVLKLIKNTLFVELYRTQFNCQQHY